MTEQLDTFERSCEHWSDAGREEMDAFYELARVDYRYLAEAYDWRGAFADLAKRKGGARLIDIACGSGKFPEALLEHSDVAGIADMTVEYDLLDPSPFSIREARSVLAPPFRGAAEFCCTLQDWDVEPGSYDVAWATHALYCVPAEELSEGLGRVCRGLSDDGFGFVAQGLRDGHYVGFYDHFRATLRDETLTPYSDGGQVDATLRKLGMQVVTREIEYTTVVPADRPRLLESYLQRCAFDDTIGLDEMMQREPLAGYLASCRDNTSGDYRFPQRVGMTVFAHSSAALAALPPSRRESVK
ncbi:MAG: SAM-dependent methyltransferase [Myxococcota bacterium]|jgi:SAM-dependent methyltransferase